MYRAYLYTGLIFEEDIDCIKYNTYILTFFFFGVAVLLLSTPHYSEGDSVHATPKFAQISKYLP